MPQVTLNKDNVLIFDDVTIKKHADERQKQLNAQRNKFRMQNGSVHCPVCKTRRISSNADRCLECAEKGLSVSFATAEQVATD